MKKRRAFVIVTLTGVVVSAWFAVDTLRTPSKSSDEQGALASREYPVEAHQIQLSGFHAPMAPEQLLYRADVGVEGEVIGISKPLWSTPTGAAPSGWEPGERLPNPEVIYTVLTVRVTDRLFGDVGSELTVAMIGGSVDDVRLVVEHAPAPNLSVGDRVVLFTYRPAGEWRLGAAQTGLVQGYLLSDGKATTPEQAPVELADLKARVESELARRASGAIEPALP